MKIRIDASAEEIAQLLKDIVVGVTKEAEERIDKAVKRAEAASLAAEVRAEQIKYTR